MANEMNRMMNYIKYGLSLKTTSADGHEYFLVGINFNKKWQIVEPSTESGVSCVAGNDGESEFYYFAPIECGVNAIFDCIDDTIHYNEDVEKKIGLLREKVAELQELFAEKPYEWLVNLQFVYESPKKDKLKRGRPKKEAPQKPVEIIKEVEEPNWKPEEGNVVWANDMTTQNLPVDHEEDFKEDKSVETGNNKDEASEIDKKIAAVLGK